MHKNIGITSLFKITSASIFLIALLSKSYGQNQYSINVNVPQKEITTGHLDLGGSNPQGEQIDVNSFYITKDGKPFFPIIGELHYARYPQKYWDEAIKKIKAGGINIIATYVFWNLHERDKGTFDWSEDLNLRYFAELCAQNKIYLIVRMGPFCHGEMRNGGMPDWLYGQTFEVRSNDAEYLEYVDKLYEAIAIQCKGLLFKDGGPIIGVQLENEYQHSAAPWEITYPGAPKEKTVASRDARIVHEQISDTDGNNPYLSEGMDHMAILKNIAKKHGMDVPLYTATGWRNAAIVEKGSIPVTAGYVYPFWSKPSPSPFYLFKDIHKYPDYMPVSYDSELYPSVSAEIGPGIQVKYSRRPVVNPTSVLPLMIRIVGSGSNGIGYYMYHGGSTPIFEGKYYNEQANGIPMVNYDFQAPIGQYGQTKYHHKSLKTRHMFLDSYGDQLAPMQTVLPPTNEKITKDDLETLRFAARVNKENGFLFLINFQDHLEIMDLEDLSISVETANETIRFPHSGTFDIGKSTSAILPFNLQLDKTLIKSATVQPLTILNNDNRKQFIFFSTVGMAPELLIAGGSEISKLSNAKKEIIEGKTLVKGTSAEVFSFMCDGNEFLILPFDLAMKANKIGDRLVFSDSDIIQENGQFSLITRSVSSQLTVYPAIKELPQATNASVKKSKACFSNASSCTISFEVPEPIINIRQVTDRKYAVTAKGELGLLNDVFLEVDYVGDRGMAFIDGLLVTDHFYHEKNWEIGLRGYLEDFQNGEMVLIFHPLYDNQECLIDFSELPKFEKGKYLKVEEIKVVNEYKAMISF